MLLSFGPLYNLGIENPFFRISVETNIVFGNVYRKTVNILTPEMLFREAGFLRRRFGVSALLLQTFGYEIS